MMCNCLERARTPLLQEGPGPRAAGLIWADSQVSKTVHDRNVEAVAMIRIQKALISRDTPGPRSVNMAVKVAWQGQPPKKSRAA